VHALACHSSIINLTPAKRKAWGVALQKELAKQIKKNLPGPVQEYVVPNMPNYARQKARGRWSMVRSKINKWIAGRRKVWRFKKPSVPLRYSRHRGAAQAPAGAMVASRGMAATSGVHERGRLLRLSGPKLRRTHPEITRIELPTAQIDARATYQVTGTVINRPFELGPQLFRNGSFSVGRAPIRGTGSGQRLKNEINVRSMMLRWKSSGWSTVGSVNYRLVILQITEPLGFATSANAEVKDADSYDILVAPGGAFMFNSTSGTRNAAVGDVTELWNQFFTEYQVSSTYNSTRAPAQPAEPTAKHPPKYKVLYDKLFLNNTIQHSGEIKLGPHVMRWHEDQNTTIAIPAESGRLVMFFVTDPVNGSGSDYGHIDMNGYLTYSDE
jgi:hypothetical protein